MGNLATPVESTHTVISINMYVQETVKLSDVYLNM